MMNSIYWSIAYISFGYFIGIAFVGFVVTVVDLRSNRSKSNKKQFFNELLMYLQFALFFIGLLTLMSVILDGMPEELDNAFNNIFFLLVAVGTIVLSKKRLKKIMIRKNKSE